MVEMPMMPTQPATEPVIADDGAAVADAPQGAFEEMLARRLGRQLIGRHTNGDQDRDHGAGDGAHDPQPWMPPAATGLPAAPVSPIPSVPEDGPAAARQPEPGAIVLEADRSISTAPIAAEAPVKLIVNRPGFRPPMAEPGLIEPGPRGEVWTHPSGFADLELVPGSGGRATASHSPSPVETTPEPPTVHWSPAPARAAMAAAANRDLELEIVTQLRGGLDPVTATPQLDLIEPGADEPVRAPNPLLPEGAGGDDTGVRQSPVPVATGTAAAANTGEGPQAPHPSSLINRVLDAVELQRHLPPPRAIAVEIPEMEGLRLLVTMRMDGTVHVTSSMPGQAPAPGQAAPLLEAVEQALTDRGFEMNGGTDGRRNMQDQPEDNAGPERPNRFRRQTPRTGLRI
jgi:hypothetical protein